jgi:glycosyltransferase involved in cell wall biosynthesis
MDLQVLVSTMHQTDHSLLEKMNIQSDAIVINQCDRNEFEEFEYKGNAIKFLSFAERGIGLSRNTGMMRATADICLFADDDVTYIDNYKEIILREFVRNPQADVIVFNVPSMNPEREEYVIKKAKRLRFYNCLRYGTFRIAIRTASVRKANISFSLLFGGGAKYSAGEDSLFMADCIKKGLQVYASPKSIGTVNHAESTWFTGYTDKYFIDKGVFFACLSKRWAKLLCLQFAIRRRNMFKEDKTVMEAYRLMLEGISERRYS